MHYSTMSVLGENNLLLAKFEAAHGLATWPISVGMVLAMMQGDWWRLLPPHCTATRA